VVLTDPEEEVAIRHEVAVGMAPEDHLRELMDEEVIPAAEEAATLLLDLREAQMAAQ
jgi:hypothetical protein